MLFWKAEKKNSLDFYLILATVVVFFIISVICVYGMFYFKFAALQDMAPALKAAYMDKMNSVISPFLIILILLLGICVPKRLMPTVWLVCFASVLVVGAVATSLSFSLKAGLVTVLAASLVLQSVILVMALAGSERLKFNKKGYWVRTGSSLIHLAIILFVFDLFFYHYHHLHLVLFWVTTLAAVPGMLFCFYADGVANLIKKTR
ncbi:MAG: hypothetical protein ACLFV2_07960 [Desulfurivibrionaceae bacterium]